MRILRCYFTCFYTTFTSCVTILFFFRLLMLNFEPDIKNVTFLSTLSRETNGMEKDAASLVVSLLLWIPRFFTPGTSDKSLHNYQTRFAFQGFFL